MCVFLNLFRIELNLESVDLKAVHGLYKNEVGAKQSVPVKSDQCRKAMLSCHVHHSPVLHVCFQCGFNIFEDKQSFIKPSDFEH